ncbi:hypothetical protein dsx2_1864 [Desulfovibrio sp. X2]|uniref:hypothetical protein n=1 Tax=Desulfovibrio sp. X2 TaxID=941449 RepID=UPI0003587D68|nr:hypothetical protein [Desulfovibrio sp. X2]EPR44120.1 hypothetical protein dsx2_1864 [Desulfovibrio sp. X2]
MERLDILLYAHDGRGIGHVSRTAAVGLALRRRHPDLRVALLSGERRVEGLVRGAPLDWIKLPSYATRVVEGRSQGAPGDCGLSDAALGEARAELIRAAAATLRPRVALADHTPQGKHRELVPALEATSGGTAWVLGVRAVVGGVGKVWSDLAAGLFRKHFRTLFWYGDRNVSPTEAERLESHFGRAPDVCGYVSRLRELDAAGLLAPAGMRRGVVMGLSWADAASPGLLRAVSEAAARTCKTLGPWRIFLDYGRGEGAGTVREEAARLFSGVPGATLCDFGEAYADAMAGARLAVVYGGYNSLTDVLAADIGGVVLLRGMKDNEQELHVAGLAARRPDLVPLDAARLDATGLVQGLEKALAAAPVRSCRAEAVSIDGAARAADLLAALVRESRSKEGEGA